MRYLIVALALTATACKTPVEADSKSPATDDTRVEDTETTEDGNDSDDQSASLDDTPAAPVCTWGDIATNGAEFEPYGATANSWYDCDGFTTDGSPTGVWVAFFDNGTSYIGIQGGKTIPLENFDPSCGFTWQDGNGTYAHANEFTLNQDGTLDTLTLAKRDANTNTYFETITYTCAVVY